MCRSERRPQSKGVDLRSQAETNAPPRELALGNARGIALALQFEAAGEEGDGYPCLMVAVAEAVEVEFLSSCFEDFLRLTSRATCCERRRYKMQIPIPQGQAPGNPCTTSRRDFAWRRWTSLIAPECRWWNNNRDFLERRATALTLGVVQIGSSSIQSVDLACWRSHQGKSYRQVQSHTEATCTAALRTSTQSEFCRRALADCRSSPSPNLQRQQMKRCQLLHLGVLKRH
jgi:hypothetical protein